MKVIFSRKGFDSSYGGFPSIILPGGKMISFPIPEKGIRKQNKETGEYDNETSAGIKGKGAEDIKFILGDKDDKIELTLEKIFKELNITEIYVPEKDTKTKKNYTKRKVEDIIFHYDPQIPMIKDSNSYAAFGQSGAAASHLLSKKIDKGDVFLFFGTFLKTFINNENKISYDTRMHKIQAIWGYMIVDDVFQIKPNDEAIYIKAGDNIEPLSKLKEHPHYVNRDRKYTEKGDNIIICGKRFGTFNFESKYQLTKVGYKKSYWKLQDFLKGANISYCGEVKDPCCFKSADIGQEFVTENFKEEEMKNWLKGLGVEMNQ